MSEVAKLLRHPNPKERALALKLNTASAYDYVQGILDPDPLVWQTAFGHKNATYALSILASKLRDLANNLLFDRHDLLLKDPRLTMDHIRLMANAIRNDPTLPVKTAAARLMLLSNLGYQDIIKRESWGHHLLFAGSNQNLGRVANHEKEQTHEHLKPIKQAFETASGEAFEPDSAGLHGIGQVSPKLVYNVGDHKLMVKPYQEEENPLAGFNEASSQALYSAAGIGHLHQPSFTSYHGEGKYKIPATVIKLDTEAVPVHQAPLNLSKQKNPALEDEARKIAIMDFVTGNRDRHAGNLMVQSNGHLLAIDHARAFEGQPIKFQNIVGKGGITTVLGHQDPKQYREAIKNWWPQVAPQVKKTFQDRISNIEHNTHRKRVEDAFNKRVAWLDNASKADFNAGEDV